MAAVATPTPVMKTSDGVRTFFKTKIKELEAKLREKTQDLRRLQAQRNELNSRGKLYLV